MKTLASVKRQHENSDCYTIIEAAQKYNVPPTTMGTVVRRNKMPGKKAGRCVYVPKILIDNIFNPHQ
jgi:putative SOS response-associated peptidase YedK